MKLAEYPAHMREAWAVFSFLRACGFRSDDIYLGVDQEGHVGVVLRAQDKEFGVMVGKIDAGLAACQQCERQWCELADQLPHETDEDLDREWEASLARRNTTPLLASLELKGFVLPMMSN
jgi:hypothetical protein